MSTFIFFDVGFLRDVPMLYRHYKKIINISIVLPRSYSRNEKGGFCETHGTFPEC